MKKKLNKTAAKIENFMGKKQQIENRNLRCLKSFILEHKPLFDSVYVDCGGYSVAWTPDIDISEWELWDNGISI